VLLALGYYDHQLHRGIARYARRAGWVLDTSMAHYGVLPTHWEGDGIITLMFPHRADIVEFVRGTSAAVVDLTQDVAVDVPRVLLDNKAIGRLGAEHLLTRGFDNLAFFKFTAAMDVRERSEAFERAARAGGAAYHALDWHSVSGTTAGLGTNWFEWLAGRLREMPVPLGIMAQSDNRATGVLSACASVGLSVPEQVAVLGVDNDELVCEFAPVQISSVDSDRERLAYEGAALLDRLMRGERPPRRTKRIPPKGLVVRASSDILAIRHLEVATALRFIWDHFREPIVALRPLPRLPEARRPHDRRGTRAQARRARQGPARRDEREDTPDSADVGLLGGRAPVARVHAGRRREPLSLPPRPPEGPRRGDGNGGIATAGTADRVYLRPLPAGLGRRTRGGGGHEMRGPTALPGGHVLPCRRAVSADGRQICGAGGPV
jgi:LacI family transcriptional regulator